MKTILLKDNNTTTTRCCNISISYFTTRTLSFWAGVAVLVFCDEQSRKVRLHLQCQTSAEGVPNQNIKDGLHDSGSDGVCPCRGAHLLHNSIIFFFFVTECDSMALAKPSYSRRRFNRHISVRTINPILRSQHPIIRSTS